MCGIVGALGNKNIVNEVLYGLKTLEYRGYDSAGIAIFDKKLSIIKDKGRVTNLEKKLLKKISTVNLLSLIQGGLRMVSPQKKMLIHIKLEILQ